MWLQASLSDIVSSNSRSILPLMDPPGAVTPGAHRVKREGGKQQSGARNSSDSWRVGWDVIHGVTHEHHDGKHFSTGQELGRKLDAVPAERRNINYDTGGYVIGANGVEFAGAKETLLHRVVKAHRDAGLPTELATAYIKELLARGADVRLGDEVNKTAAQLDVERSLFGWPYFPMLVPGANAEAVQKVCDPQPSATGRKAPTDRFVETFGDFLDHLELHLEELQRMEQQATRDPLEMYRQAQDTHGAAPAAAELVTVVIPPGPAGLLLGVHDDGVRSRVVKIATTSALAGLVLEGDVVQTLDGSDVSRLLPAQITKLVVSKMHQQRLLVIERPGGDGGVKLNAPSPSSVRDDAAAEAGAGDDKRASAIVDNDAAAPLRPATDGDHEHYVDRSGNGFAISDHDDGTSGEIIVLEYGTNSGVEQPEEHHFYLCMPPELADLDREITHAAVTDLNNCSC